MRQPEPSKPATTASRKGAKSALSSVKEHVPGIGSAMPQSLRIQPEVMELATAVAEAQGEGQVASILRQALACGVLVLAASLAPDAEGKLATIEPEVLAKSLRRKLAAAIDLLAEHGQLPYSGMVSIAPMAAMPAASPTQTAPIKRVETLLALDTQMGDDLDALGIGTGLGFAELEA